MDDTQIKIELTGNPFVDTGLAVIASLANLDDIQELNLSHLKKIFGDGTQLADTNAKLKTFTQVFGTNNPLFQPSYGFKKGVGPSEVNKAIYKHTLKGFLEEIGKREFGQKCWACGDSTHFQFSQVCKKAIEAEGKTAPDEKWIGREWFPLAGSLGSDAQALPAASQTPVLCPKCLYAVHYLPQGLMLLDGRLAVFQSTSSEFWYELIQNIVNEIKSRVNTGNNETLGKNEGSREVMRRLLPLFERLQNSSRHHEIPKGTSLNIWRFSNSGTNPECMIEEVPNPALIFLWNATKMGLRSELESLIKFEKKNPQNSLYHCISNGKNYPYLYPDGKKTGASLNLFTLYQTKILLRPIVSLQISYKLAKTVVANASEKDLKRIQRSEAFNEEKIRVQVRHSIVQMAEQGELTLNEYLDLFPLNEGNGISVKSDGWDLIRFHLYHASEEFPNLDDISRRERSVNPVQYYAATIYNHYLKERGKERFQKEILSRISREIDLLWLKNQFTHLAESEKGFSYENWENLCKRDNGRVFISELIFQMRLLWIQWLREESVSIHSPRPCANGYNGIPENINILLEMIFRDYVKQRGISRFYQDILIKLRKHELGISWFKDKVMVLAPPEMQPLSEQEWDDFLIDEVGSNVKTERLFQINLVFANLYRMAMCNEQLMVGR